ncbi:MAG: hypothetical protein NZQ09_17240 [Chloroflexus sp.]|nr:hypothetical protein [Chloroflexus sp.]
MGRRTGSALVSASTEFQSPHGDFGFLKIGAIEISRTNTSGVSIPSRGFWFFELD